MEKVPENSDFSDLINSIIFVLILFFCISFFLSHENCKNVTYFANNPGIICTSADTKYQSGIMAWIISRISDSYSFKLLFTILETLLSYFKSLGRHDQQNIKEGRQGGETRLLKIAKSNLPPFSGLLWPFLYVSHGICSGTFFVSFCFYFQPFLCLTNNFSQSYKVKQSRKIHSSST